MPAFMKLIATSLAAAVLGMALAAAPALAAGPATAPEVTPPTERKVSVAIDALRDVLDAMADRGAMTPPQRDAVVVAVRLADWDGYSIERLGGILQALVDRGVLSAAQRFAILDGMRR
ncbi:MAG TPA: hypothetical protein VFC31_11095 [Candidatus Limnocylindria bacterium]|nr:hypothetical protein [Candidatus Limnocylindria bacterium]